MSPGDGYHITAEAWLQDNSGNWIEVGEIARNGESASYFWADHRPGHDFAEHDLAQVSEQQLGWQVFYEISKSSIENTFDVRIYSSDWSFMGKSTDNTMTPSGWSVGQELAGSINGAYAARASYQNLIAADWAPGIPGVHGEKTPDALIINMPLFGAWTNPPALTGNIFPGQDLVQSGTFQTHCCTGP